LIDMELQARAVSVPSSGWHEIDVRGAWGISSDPRHSVFEDLALLVPLCLGIEMHEIAASALSSIGTRRLAAHWTRRDDPQYTSAQRTA
jgi:hypothetical protein